MTNATAINVDALLETGNRECLVEVGEKRLVLRTANLLQDAIFLEQISSLELENLVEPIANLMLQHEAAQKDWRKQIIEEIDLRIEAGEIKKNDRAKEIETAAEEQGGPDNTSMLGRLKAIAPEAWRAARPVIGRQLIPVLTKVSVVMLDTERNYELLRALDLVDEGEEEERDDDGTYLGHPRVRAWVKGELDSNQAASLLHAIYALNKYGETLGKLLKVGTTKEEAPAKTQKRKTRTKSRQRTSPSSN